MKKTMSGFTIVELLIVIVVIAILATISIVAYNGIQQRAQNTKTIGAIRDWAQILRMYKADAGAYPVSGSCLGEGYGRGFSGADVTGGECRQDDASSPYNVNTATFMPLMGKYMQGSPPTPSFVTAGSASFPWYRGLSYIPGYTGSKDRIDAIFAGSDTECPSVAGLTVRQRGVYSATNSVRCVLDFPDSNF